MTIALYSEINIFCILILLLIWMKIKSGPYVQSEQRAFRWVLLSNCLFYLIDALWIFVDSKTLLSGVFFNRALNVLYFILSGVVSYLWFIYSEEMQHSRLVTDKRYRFICTVPVLLLVVLSLVSLKTGWLFYIDETNAYHRGPLYTLQLLLSYGYIIFTAVKALLLSYRAVSYEKRERYRTLAMFVVPPIIAGIVQTVIPGVSLICAGSTLGILYVFATLQEQMISVDSLTGLSNRNRMMRYLSDRMSHREENMRLFLVMMDLDYFKQINDMFGHVEGDNALRETAEALKTCSKDQRHFVARYGGDEFAFICELNADESIDEVCVKIHEAMKLVNSGREYTLSLSMGTAKYTDDMKTYQDFINLADSKLYAAKQARQRV